MTLDEFDYKETINWLIAKHFIKMVDGKFEPTYMGRMTSLLYIKPETTLNFIRAMYQFNENSSLIEVFVEMLCTKEYMDNISIRKEDEDKIELAKRFFLESDPEIFDKHQITNEVLKGFYLTFLDTFVEKYKIQKSALKFISGGDKYILKESGQRLMGCASIIITNADIRAKCSAMEKLIGVGKYKPEIANLLNLKGIGDKRASKLIKEGIMTVEDFISKTPEQIADILAVGIDSVVKFKESAGEYMNAKYTL